jgi:hypothetical protein
MVSNDGDAPCSSRESRSSIGDKTNWRRRAPSLARKSPKQSSSRPSSCQRPASETTKEIRITLKPRPLESIKSIDITVSPTASPTATTTTTTTPPIIPTIALPTVELKTLYFCTNCDESFQERDDWQNHEDLQHERQYFWCCPSPGCDKVFNSAADFTAHHARSHACHRCSHADDIRRPLPSKRSWGCGFDQCKRYFDSWDQRCDHVAAHFEQLAAMDDDHLVACPSEWKYANMLRNLLRQPDIREAYKRMLVSFHGADKFFWPKMRWHPSNTVELLRKLEYRDFREGVQEIARVACSLGQPAQAEMVRIVEPPSPDKAAAAEAEVAAAATAPAPQQDDGFLHIDKFPQPGTNPFDLYGPVPPSPIIQLDFVSDPSSPDPEVEIFHSTKSSLSQVPYSLYPSPTIMEKEHLLTPPRSRAPSLFTVHSPGSTEALATTDQFQTATTWATAFSSSDHPLHNHHHHHLPHHHHHSSNNGHHHHHSPPRPKTPLAMMIRSASRSLRKKKSAPVIPRSSSHDHFDSVAAGQAISMYHAR